MKLYYQLSTGESLTQGYGNQIASRLEDDGVDSVAGLDGRVVVSGGEGGVQLDTFVYEVRVSHGTVDPRVVPQTTTAFLLPTASNIERPNPGPPQLTLRPICSRSRSRQCSGTCPACTSCCSCGPCTSRHSRSQAEGNITLL